MDLTSYNERNTENLEYFCDIPEVCKTQPCVLGVDEAGRGPVLGPMVYGISFCPVEKNRDLKELGVDDSKALTEEQRGKLLDKIVDNSDYIGWAIHVLSPRYISTSMYKRGKYNLNSMSHDCAIGLIKAAIEKGVKVSEVYVDTVGPPEKYEAKLSGVFPDLKITVAKKADSLYACVSAASICAKVARDRALANWKFAEGERAEGPTGSGYPGDPLTKKFLQTNSHHVFGFPEIVRFSWKTAEKIMTEKGIQVDWEEVEPEEDTQANPSIADFIVKMAKPGKQSRIHPYFRERCIQPLTTL